MNLDLNDIYTDGTDNEAPVAIPKDAGKTFWGNPALSKPYDSPSSTSNVYTPEYEGYTNRGVHEGVRNIDIERGQNQSALEKWGNFVPRVVGKVVTGVIEGISYLPELFTPNSDYSNFGTEAAQNANAWLDKNFPIYRKSEGVFGSPTDLGWWLQNGEGLVSSVASFAIEGAGFAKLLGGVGKVGSIGARIERGLGMLSNAKTAARITSAANQTMTAGMLAYTEGAMSGKRVYDEVYNAQLEKLLAQGLDPMTAHGKAKMIAAESASSTVQLNTIINTGLNLVGGVSQFFNHDKNHVIEAARRHLFAQEGESTAAWLTRLATEDGSKYAREITGYLQGEGKKMLLKQGLKRSKEALAEGTEELTNQFAERTGIEEGKEGKVYNMVNQFGQLSKYFDRTMDQEGALNFLMGAIAGPAQQALTHHIPLHKVETGVRTNASGQMINEKGDVVESAEDAAKEYAKGSFGMNRVSAFQSRTVYGIKFFNDIRDKVKEDATAIVKIENDMKAAVVAGKPLEAERLRDEYFNLINKNSVALGFSENLKETYRNTLKVDNTITEKDKVEQQIAQTEEAITTGKTNGEDTTDLENQLKDFRLAYDKASDKTEAQLLGFTDSKENNDYKKKAQDAIQTLAELQKIHDDVQRKFGPEETSTNLEQAHVADFIFDRSANLHLLKKTKKDYEKILSEIDPPLGITDEYTAQVAAEKRYHQRTSNLLYQLDKIERDLDTLRKHSNAPSPEGTKLLSRYGALNVTPGTEKKETASVLSKLEARRNELVEDLKTQEDEVLETEGYKKYLEGGGKSYKGYTEYLAKNYEYSAKQKAYAAALGEINTEISTHEEFLAELEKTPTLDRIQKNTEDFFRKLNKTRNAAELKKAEKLKERLSNDKRIAELRVRRLNQLRDRFQQEFEELNKEIQKKEAELAKLVHDLRYFRRRPKRETAEQSTDRWEKLKLEKDKLFYELEEIDRKRQAILKSVFEIDEKLAEAEGKPTTEEPPVVDEDAIEETQQLGNEEVEDLPESNLDDAMGEEPEQEQSIAVAEYYALLDSLPEGGKEAVEDLRTAILTGQAPFSLSALLLDESMGTIPDGMGPVIMTAMRKFLEEQKAEIAEANELEEVLAGDETELPPNPEIVAEEGEEFDLPFDNDGQETEEPTAEILAKDEKEFIGTKQTSPFDSLAQRSIEFGQASDDKGDYIKVGKAKLNPNLNPDVVAPWALHAGTSLTFEIDTSYTGTVIDYDGDINRTPEDFQKEEDIAKYMENGKVKLDPDSVGNVPIKISSNGKVIGYIHRNEWISATREDTAGPERFANTVDIIEGIAGNVDRQLQLSLQQRYAIVQAFNRGITKLTGKVTDKAAGKLIPLPDYDKASVHLKNIALGVVMDGQIYGLNTKQTLSSDYHNYTVAMIPRADGSFTPTVLKGTPLEDTDALEVISRLTELLIAPNTEKNRKEINFINEATGFDVGTVDGYRGYIIQHYTHFTTMKSFLASSKVKSIIDTDDRGTPRITLRDQTGTHQPISATLDSSGKLSPEFKRALAELFKGRYKTVSLTKKGLKGVNDASDFYYVGLKKGEWTVNPRHGGNATTYNDYILPYLYTNLTFAKGSNENGSTPVTSRTGRKTSIFVYDVNPIIKFEVDLPQDRVIKPETVEEVKEEPTTKYDGNVQEGEQALRDMGFDFEDMRPELQSVGTTEDAPVSLESLQKLFFSLDPSERNGLTPSQVLQQYRQDNITHPAKNYNPFKKCE